MESTSVATVSSSAEDKAALLRIRDRLYICDDNNFGTILTQGQLLPKLLQMTNTTALREDSVLLQLIQYIIRRIKETELYSKLDCSSLFVLVDEAQLPFCCNFALVLLEIGLKNVPPEKLPEYSSELLKAIGRFPPFSGQSNGLLNMIFAFLDSISDSILNFPSSERENISRIIGDWLMDVSLLTHEISKGTAGSILPGLSKARVDRLLAKKERLLIHDSKILKLQILNMHKTTWIPSHLWFNIVCILTCDQDATISREATYKLSACITQYQGSSDEEKALLINAVLHLSTTKCSLLDRSILRDDVSLAQFDFMAKNFQISLADNSDSLLQVFTDRFSTEISSLKRFHAKFLVLIEHTMDKCIDLQAFETFAPRVLSIITALLKGFVSANTSVEGLHLVGLRQSCYKIYTIITKRCGLLHGVNFEPILILFRLLDIEDNDVLVDLYALLEELRKSFELNKSEAFTGLSSEHVLIALKKCATSDNSKRKLIALLWAKALLGWDSFMFEQLLVFADDANEDVSKACSQIFSEYQNTIKSYFELSHALVYVKFAPYAIEKLLVQGKNILKEQAALLCFQTLTAILQQLMKQYYPLSGLDTLSWNGASFAAMLSEANVIPNDLQLMILDILKATEHLPISSLSGVPRGLATVPTLKVYVECLPLLIFCGGSQARQIASSYIASYFMNLSHIGEHDETSLRQLSISIGMLTIETDMTFIWNCIRVFGYKLKDSSSSLNNTAYCYACFVECLLIRLNFVSTLSNNNNDINRELCDICRDFASTVVVTRFQGLSKYEKSSDGEKELDLDIIFISALHPLSKLLANLLPFESRLIGNMPLANYALSTLSNQDDVFTRIYSISTAIIGSTATKLTAELVTLLSHVCCAGVSRELYTGVWTLLSSPSVLYGNEMTAYKFKLAEALVRMALISTQDQIELPSAVDSEFFWDYPLVVQLLRLIEGNLKEETLAKRSATNVLLMVLLKELKESKRIVIPDAFIFRSAQWFLLSLREADAFIQDVSCLGLCLCYETASSTSEKLASLIGDEVYFCLTREKRKPQPAGFNDAGQHNSDTTTTTGGTTATTGGGTGGDATAPATGGGAPLPQLNIPADISGMQASLAAEFGQFLENSAPQRATESSDDRYGVYTTICHIVKKSGLTKLLFTVLALIQRDPTFVTGQSESFYTSYHVPGNVLTEQELDKIVPMLFLYRYEPQTSIREIMLKLWQKIVPSDQSKRIVDKLESGILSNLITSLSSKSWRHREAACIALENFLFSRKWEIISQHMESLWEGGIRVLDDIRDTTRKAALGFMKCLADHLVKSCDPLESSEAKSQIAINFIVPWLLEKGLLLPSQDQLGFCFSLLIRLIKTAKSRLRVYLPKMIGVLAESMSALEPRALSYLEFHTQRLNISQEDYESNRIQVAAQSPMQESLDWCLKSLDRDALPLALLTLKDTLQSGVGLATKVSASQSLSFIAEKYSTFIIEEAIQIFQYLVQYTAMRAPKQVALQNALLNSLRLFTKIVHPEYVSEACNLIIEQYLMSADEDVRQMLASTLLQIVNGSVNHDLGDTWRVIVNVAYIGTFDSISKICGLWTKVFNESIQCAGYGTKSSALSAISIDTLTACKYLLGDLNWNKRSQAISVILDMLECVSLDRIDANIPPVFAALLYLIPGQIWTGQDKIFDALTKLACKFKERIDVDASKDVLFVACEFSVMTDQLVGQNATRIDLISVSSAGWRLSLRGYTALLLNEAQRGPPQYKLAAVVALSELPWNHICKVSPYFFAEYMEVWLECAGIETVPVERGASATAHKPVKKPKDTPQRSVQQMFGDRYGNMPVSKKPKPSAPQPLPSRDAVETDVAVVDSEEAVIVDNVDTGRDSEQIVTKLPPEPAYRVKILETIAKCWPASILPSDEYYSLLENIKAQLTTWAYVVMTNDIWSIRRVALLVLGATISRQTSIDECQRIFACISAALSDAKFAQIRKAALHLLEILLERLDKDIVLSLKTDFRKLILQGCNDSQPDVIECASNVQKIFVKAVIV